MNNTVLNDINENLKTIIHLLQKNLKKNKKKIKNNTKIINSNSNSNSETKFIRKILLTNFKNCLFLHGNTFPYKEQIKEMKGKWNSNHKGWIIPKDNLDMVMEKLPEINYNGVENEKELQILID